MKKVIGKKAEWLKGNNNARIRLNFNTMHDFQCKWSFYDNNGYKQPINFEGVLGDRWLINSDPNTAEINTYLDYWGGKRRMLGILGFDVIYNFKATIKENIFSFYLNDNNVANYSAVDKGMKQLSLAYNCCFACFLSETLRLLPIQLIQDIPAYLSSDNLPHSAGECGMWDSVNEKFYGNANTSGEFSVENELDEYIEVDLTGICINGKYQRVSVENNEIPRLMHNGKEVRALVFNGEIVWKESPSLKLTYTQYIDLDIILNKSDNPKFVLDFALLEMPSPNFSKDRLFQILFAASDRRTQADGPTTQNRFGALWEGREDNGVRYDVFNSINFSSENNFFKYEKFDTMRHKIIIDVFNNNESWDKTTANIPQMDGTTSAETITINAHKYLERPYIQKNTWGGIKIYKCEIYLNNKLRYNLIPAENGLFDTINNTKYLIKNLACDFP